MADHHIDCKGMNCPMPIVHIAKAFRTMAPGDTLTVEADDPAFGADVQAWVRRMGHRLDALEAEGAKQSATLTKTPEGR